MSQTTTPTRKPRLVWIHPGSLSKLAASTWLEPTRELRRSGWNVELVAGGAAGSQELQGVEVLCVPMPKMYAVGRLALHYRMLAALRSQWSEVDIVLFHHLSAPWLLPLRLTRWLAGRRRPLLVMDTRTVPMASRTLKDWLRGAFERMSNALANLFADGQTAITTRMAEAVRIPPDKLWGVWPSGVDAERFAAGAKLRKWPTGAEPVELIYTGALHYERNLLTMCEAVVEARRRGGNVRLSLVGSGTHEKELREFADASGGAIRVGDAVLPQAMPELLASAHVGVLPFPDEEKYRVCSPIKLFEYMGSGMPVLATRVVCHTDVIGDGQFACWAEGADKESLTDAVLRIAGARDRLPQMGEQSAAAVSQWTWQEAAHKLRRALEHGLRVRGIAPAAETTAKANGHRAPAAKSQPEEATSLA